MKLKVFSVYDSAVASYSNPFFLTSIGEAKRGWTEVCKDPSTKMNKYPAEFTLFMLGEFDDVNGKFENLHTPESLGTALQALSQEKN